MENKAVLIDFMGSDDLHGLSAWASTFLELGVPMPENVEMRVPEIVAHILKNNKRKRSLGTLLSYLADEKHESPFRMSGFVFLMTNDIATHIHFLKHRVLLEADNAESARYKELSEDKFYIPADWPKALQDKLQASCEAQAELYRSTLIELQEAGLSRQRAKETARYFMPYATQLNCVRKFSFAGLMELHRKRGLGSPSQREIGHLVESMIQQVQDTGRFNLSLSAFGLS